MRFADFALCADFKSTDLTHLGTIGWSDRADGVPFLARLKQRFGIAECFFLQSCNRREFYFHAPDMDLTPEAFAQAFYPLLAEALGVEVAPAWFELFVGEACVRRLMRVAASLESMVVGETEITRQIRDQFEATAAAGLCGKHMRALVQTALRASKRVRSETRITRNVTSMASLIHRAVRDHLAGKCGTVVFVGAGHFMETLLPPFAKMTEHQFVFVNRTCPTDLAASYGGTARGLADFLTAPGPFDVLISATAAPHALIDRAWLDAQVGESRRLLLVDGALPRDIAPDCAERPHTQVLDLAHMDHTLADNRARRLAEIPKTEPIFDAAVAELEQACHELALGALHAEMADYYQDTAQRALACLLKQQQEVLTDQQRAVLTAFSQNLARKLVSVPVLGLKGVARELGDEGVSAWVRGISSGSRLFAS